MSVVLPSPDSPAAIRGRKQWVPSIHGDTILTDNHDCEVSAAFGDNSVPLRKRTSEQPRRRTQRGGRTWLGKFAIPIPLISANESRNSSEVRGGRGASDPGWNNPELSLFPSVIPTSRHRTRFSISKVPICIFFYIFPGSTNHTQNVIFNLGLIWVQFGTCSILSLRSQQDAVSSPLDDSCGPLRQGDQSRPPPLPHPQARIEKTPQTARSDEAWVPRVFACPYAVPGT